MIYVEKIQAENFPFNIPVTMKNINIQVNFESF